MITYNFFCSVVIESSGESYEEAYETAQKALDSYTQVARESGGYKAWFEVIEHEEVTP